MKARRARKGHGGGGGGGVGRGRSRGSSVRLSTAPSGVNHIKFDLNSRSATTIANITFLPVHQHTFPIIHFDCYDSLRTCQQIREWLDAEETEEIRALIRFDDQELNLIGTEKKGKVILLEGAAALNNNPLAPITVLALLMPKDDRIRFFWCLVSPSSLLTDLTAANLLGPPRTFSSGPLRYSADGNLLPPRHHTLYTILTQNFHSATTYPDSPDFKAASLISDLCPEIKDPAHAARRIEANDELHTGNNPMNDGKDLFDDRYILELPPAEHALACLVFAGCAEYLLIKRIYFKAFSRELVLNASKVRRAAALQRGKTLTGKQNRIANNQDQDGEDDGNDKEVKHEDVKDEDVKREGLRADTPNAASMALRSRAVADLASLPTHDPAHLTNAQIGAMNRELRVRTKNRHTRVVQAQTGWNFARAKKMAIGWEMLGFLEEKRVLDVVEGRENNEGEEYENDDDDDDDDEDDDKSVTSEVTLA